MRRGGLWGNTRFVDLWGAATVSTFGSFVTGTALPFTAILLLDASPSAIGVLRVAELLPGFLFGLVAGAWVDRLSRKPIMIATDLGRALVKNDELVEANSKLSAAMSVAEASAFSSAGWLIQLLTAPVAMLVDAVTFLASAGLVARIREPELKVESNPAESRPSVASEVGEGLRAVWRQPILRGMVFAGLAQNLAFGLVGTVYLLYVNQEVGFNPGILGMIFAVGGVSSFLGAMIAGRLPRFGIGTVMIASLLLATIGQAFVPLATAA